MKNIARMSFACQNYSSLQLDTV